MKAIVVVLELIAIVEAFMLRANGIIPAWVSYVICGICGFIAAGVFKKTVT